MKRSLTALALLACLSSSCMTGGGTDVGNPDLVGSIRHKDGSPAALVSLHLRPKTYLINPDSVPVGTNKGGIQDRISDTQGFFTFDSVPKGEYRIEAMEGDTRGAVLEVATDGTQERLSLAQMTLDSTGSITGRINYLRPVKSVLPKIIIAIYGSHLYTAATTDGQFTFSNLPPGAYTLHVSTQDGSSGAVYTAEFPSLVLKAGEHPSVGSVDLGQ